MISQDSASWKDRDKTKKKLPNPFIGVKLPEAQRRRIVLRNFLVDDHGLTWFHKDMKRESCRKRVHVNDAVALDTKESFLLGYEDYHHRFLENRVNFSKSAVDIRNHVPESGNQLAMTTSQSWAKASSATKLKYYTQLDGEVRNCSAMLESSIKELRRAQGLLTLKEEAKELAEADALIPRYHLGFMP
eukprot:GEMP01061776.1.p1 GENE.GEMP01061776.1~~GEMP01061776.1.p1  ORF type:complete len:188 (+),score=43.08 GEMP01061776.1:231-794(+)